MNKTNIMNLWLGWSTGYRYSDMNNQKDIFKSQPVSALNAFGQLSQLGDLISTVNQHLPSHPLKRSVNVLCNIVPLVSIAGIFFCDAVRGGKVNLNHRVTSFFNFIAGHLGNVVRVAVIAASIGLIVLGNTAYGGAALTAFAYQAIDRMGFVPRRISLFVETYISTVSLAGTCLSGTLLVRVLSGIALATDLIPSSSRYLHQKIDAFAHRFLDSGPTLKEIDAPLVRREEMSFDEINAILNADNLNHYKINPAHCVQPSINLDEFSPDHDFGKYLSLFDKMDWETMCHPLKNESKDNEDSKNSEGSIDLLLKMFPDIEQEAIKKEIDTYIEKFASQSDLPRKKHVANWMRQQMNRFIEILQGKKRVIGSQQHLDEAIQICAQLLPYLSSLKPEVKANKVKLERILAYLAIHGGSCDALKIKTAVNELISKFIQNDIQVTIDIEDPIKDFEIQVLKTLQNHRSELFQKVSKNIVQEGEESGQPHFISEMMLDSFRLGLIPLTKSERQHFGFLQIFQWIACFENRDTFYWMYKQRLNGIITRTTSLDPHYTNYFHAIINSNHRLSAEERKILLAKFDEKDNGQWTPEDTLTKFRRVLFVRMGILIPV